MSRLRLLPVVLSILLVGSCGGGGSSDEDSSVVTPPPAPPIPAGMVQLTGQVVAPAGVEAQSLTVISLNVESSIASDGSFMALVREDAVTALMAAKADGSFGLINISVDTATNGIDAIELSVESTAVALAFLTAQLLTTDPDVALETLAVIEQDVNLPSLTTAVENSFGDGDPLANLDLQSALRATVESVGSTIQQTGKASPGTIQHSGNSLVHKPAVIRLPKRSQNVIESIQSAPPVVHTSVDAFYIKFTAQETNDEYLIDTDSVLLNAVDWYTEFAEVDTTGFSSLEDLITLSTNKFSPYPRAPAGESYIGHDIVHANGILRFADPVAYVVELAFDAAIGEIFPDGVSIPLERDGVYLARVFSGGSRLSDPSEHTFVNDQVPNGSRNHNLAGIINAASVAIELASLVYELENNDCMSNAAVSLVVQLNADSYLEDSVPVDFEGFAGIVSEAMGSFGACAVSSSSGLSNLVSRVIGISSGWLKGAVAVSIISERVSSLLFSSSPLESALFVVGSPECLIDREPPIVPAGVGASAFSTSEIDVSWQESTDNDAVAEYWVYRDGSTDPILTVTDTTARDAGLAPGTQHCFSVSAVDMCGNESDRSSPAACATTSSVPDTSPPTIPQNITATPFSDIQIDISWNPSSDTGSGVAGYEVYRDDELVATVSGTTASDLGLSPTTEYCYTVVAFDAAGNLSDPTSPPSCATTSATSDTTAPAVPTGVTVSAISQTEISVAWAETTDDSGSVAGYRVFRDSVEIGITSALEFTDGGLEVVATYCYMVSAYDAAGNESLPSISPACETTLSEPDTTAPSIPTGLSVETTSTTELTLSWLASNDNVGVTGYNIYRDTIFLDLVTELDFIDTELSASTEYCYQIEAVDAAGNPSQLSTETCATTSASSNVSFALTRQVDTSTTIPGQTGQFSSFQEVKLTSDGFVFRSGGYYSLPVSDSTGIYQFGGGELTVVADDTTPTPVGDGNFSLFSGLAVDGSNTYFLADKALASDWLGVFTATPSGIQTVVDTQADVPGRDQPWTGFSSVDTTNGLITFSAADAFAGYYGFYQVGGGAVELITDRNEIIFGTPILVEPGKVLFIEQDNVALFENDVITPVANREIIWPGQYDDNASVSFNYLGTDGLEPTFHTTLRTPTGYEYVHRATSTGIETLVDSDDSVTGDPDSFNIAPISNPIVRNSIVLMEAYEVNWNPGYRRGVMLKKDGALYRVVTTQQPLDGVEVEYVWVNDFDGERFALVVEFIDGTKAIYIGSIVEN